MTKFYIRVLVCCLVPIKSLYLTLCITKKKKRKHGGKVKLVVILVVINEER